MQGLPSGADVVVPVPDVRRVSSHMSRTAAEQLAKAIAGYWRGRGFFGIEVSVEPDFGIRKLERYRKGRLKDRSELDEIWCVRSNIGPLGVPPREASQRERVA